MQIRKKLTYQFVFIVAIILVLFSISVYYFSSDHRRENFYHRLKNKSISIANLLIEVEEIDSALLRKIETDNPLSLPQEKVLVYNYLDDVIFSTDSDNIFKVDKELLNKIRLQGEIHFRQGKYEMLGLLYTSRYDRFVVIAGAIDIYGLEKLVNLRTVLLIAFGICIIIIFVAGSIYSGRALLPVSNIISQVNAISPSSMNLRLAEGNKKDELALLSRTFNKMLHRLEAAFTVQKNFIANASHELRTPLTAISGQMEVLLMQNRSPEQYRQAIASVLEDVQNLNLVANRLLLLAQASAESSESAFKPVRIDEILWLTKSEVKKINSQWQVNISFDHALEDSHFTIDGNEQLIRTALFNLIDNGCKYSADHRTDVFLTTRRGMLTITFSDKGIGIPPEDKEHIFEPFRRGRNTEQIRGHGIGLSLVQKIIQLHKGEIVIQSELNQGTTVSVSFPPAKF